MEIDNETGLPVVPENYYWQVKVIWEEYASVPTAFVKLRKRGTWFSVVEGSFLLGRLHPDDIAAGRDEFNRHRDYVKLDPSEYSAAVAELAEKVMNKHANKLAFESYYNKFKAEAKRLSGKYPPKKLEVM